MRMIALTYLTVRRTFLCEKTLSRGNTREQNNGEAGD